MARSGGNREDIETVSLKWLRGILMNHPEVVRHDQVERIFDLIYAYHVTERREDYSPDDPDISSWFGGDDHD